MHFAAEAGGGSKGVVKGKGKGKGGKVFWLTVHIDTKKGHSKALKGERDRHTPVLVTGQSAELFGALQLELKGSTAAVERAQKRGHLSNGDFDQFSDTRILRDCYIVKEEVRCDPTTPCPLAPPSIREPSLTEVKASRRVLISGRAGGGGGGGAVSGRGRGAPPPPVGADEKPRHIFTNPPCVQYSPAGEQRRHDRREAFNAKEAESGTTPPHTPTPPRPMVLHLLRREASNF